MPRDDFDPEGQRLPIKIDRTSNGEHLPPLLTPTQKLARQLAHDAAGENSSRYGMRGAACRVKEGQTSRQEGCT